MNQLENIGTVRPTITSYLWEVKNFTKNIPCKTCKSGQDTGTRLISPVFSTNYSSIKHEWCLHLFPVSPVEQYKDHMGLYVTYLGHSDIQVNFILSILDDAFCKVHQEIYVRSFEEGSLPYGSLAFIKLNFVKDRTNRLLVNDTINILFELIYEINLAEPSLKRRRVEKDLPDHNRLQEFDEFEKLMEAENSADVVIKIGKDKIKVHKAIIMSRSPVFQAMFEHDMKEKKQSVVEIKDIEYGVMKEVVRFMYVGKVNNGKEIADDLLVAADKYSIKGLKVLCEKLLSESLNMINVVEHLLLATTYNSDNLKSKIINFIVSNCKNIIHDHAFKALPSNVKLEVLYALLSHPSDE